MMKKRKQTVGEIRADKESYLIQSLKTAATTEELLKAADIIGDQAEKVSIEDKKLIDEIRGSLGMENKG